MRLVLDAHVSPRRVASALRDQGHDVRAAGEERQHDGTSDEDLLALATSEERVLVTFNVRDFARIARRWAEAGRSHFGCALLAGIDHREFGVIIRAVQRGLEVRPGDWRDHTCFVSRGT